MTRCAGPGSTRNERWLIDVFDKSDLYGPVGDPRAPGRRRASRPGREPACGCRSRATSAGDTTCPVVPTSTRCPVTPGTVARSARSRQRVPAEVPGQWVGAAAWSRNQMVSSRPRTPRAGVRGSPSAARAAATASALSSPEARNQTARLRLRAPKVRVIRSGGGLGESRTAGGDPVVDVEGRVAGEERGAVAVGADAEHQHVELAGAVLAQRLRRTPRRRPRRSAASAVEGISCTWAGSTPTESRKASRAWRALRSSAVGRHEPLVAPPDDHARPVDAGDAGDERGDPAVQGLGDGAAGQRDLGYAARGLGGGEPLEQPARHGVGQRVARRRGPRSPGSALTTRPASPAPARSRRRRRPRRGAAAPRRAARAASLRLSATGRSGLPGEVKVASLPSAAVDPDRAVLGLHAPPTVMPGPVGACAG